MKFKVAVIEDDALISYMIKLNLEKQGYQVENFLSAELIQSQFENKSYDLILLDLFLPGISGLELLRRMRSSGDLTPVLIVTVKSDVQTRIQALNMGADDYILKPFNMEELLARVKALIRRSQGKRSLPSSQVLIINGHRINLASRICESNHGEVVLSEKEVKLISYLALHSHETLSRADILEEVWGMEVAPTPRTVDNFIGKLRKLFEADPEKPRHFLSVRGKGYRFEQ